MPAFVVVIVVVYCGMSLSLSLPHHQPTTPDHTGKEGERFMATPLIIESSLISANYVSRRKMVNRYTMIGHTVRRMKKKKRSLHQKRKKSAVLCTGKIYQLKVLLVVALVMSYGAMAAVVTACRLAG